MQRFLAGFVLASAVGFQALAGLIHPDLEAKVVKVETMIDGVVFASTTGFFVSSEGHVLASVDALFMPSLSALSVLRITLSDGRSFAGKDIQVFGRPDADFDFFLLKVPVNGTPFFSVRKQPLNPGEEVFQIGQLGASGFHEDAGRAVNLDIKTVVVKWDFFAKSPAAVPAFLTTLPISVGMGGAPIFDARGDLVGTSAWCREWDATSHYFPARRASELAQFINKQIKAGPKTFTSVLTSSRLAAEDKLRAEANLVSFGADAILSGKPLGKDWERVRFSGMHDQALDFAVPRLSKYSVFTPESINLHSTAGRLNVVSYPMERLKVTNLMELKQKPLQPPKLNKGLSLTIDAELWTKLTDGLKLDRLKYFMTDARPATCFEPGWTKQDLGQWFRCDRLITNSSAIGRERREIYLQRPSSSEFLYFAAEYDDTVRIVIDKAAEAIIRSAKIVNLPPDRGLASVPAGAPAPTK